MNCVISRMPAFAAVLLAAGVCVTLPDAKEPAVRSAKPGSRCAPESLAFSPDGTILAVADRGAGRIVFIGAGVGTVLREMALRGRPAGLAWLNARRVLVSENGAGALAEVDADRGVVSRRIPVARYAEGLAVVPGGRQAIVCDRGRHQVQIVDLDAGTVAAEIPAVNQPCKVAVTRDGAVAAVANLLPAGDARSSELGAKLTLIDLRTRSKIKDVALPAGAVNVRGLAISANGHWAYALHNIARTDHGTTHLERGWLMANAVSVIDLRERSLLGSRVLDALEDGAANPWGAVIAPGGAEMWITLSGTHQAARIDLDNLHSVLGAPRSAGQSAASAVADAPTVTPDLDCDWDMGDACSSYLPRIIRRIDLPGNGPRGIAVGPRGIVAIAQYFSGDVAFLDGTGTRCETARIGRPPDTPAWRGERAFHDASLCRERWLSCASCHPDGRADGLNWDLMNDGEGNPKNTKSLVWSDRTPPMMATGVRKSMEEAVRKGFENIQFATVPDPVLEDVCAYLRNLEPDPSPYLERGMPNAQAQHGRKIFLSAGCARCHPAPLWTDLKSYDVGTGREYDRCAVFDTPTCAELWRTAPYLHDGSAPDLGALLRGRRAGDPHGKAGSLRSEDMEALMAYLDSL